MTEDRAGHNGEREPGAEPCGRRKQNQNCRDQFNNAGTNATPRFESDFAKDINGFRRARELEKECLQENDRCGDTANPGDDCRCFAGVIHKEFSFPISSEKKPIPYSGLGAGEPKRRADSRRERRAGRAGAMTTL